MQPVMRANQRSIKNSSNTSACKLIRELHRLALQRPDENHVVT